MPNGKAGLVAGFFLPSEMPLALRTFDLKKQTVGALTSGGGQAFPYGGRLQELSATRLLN